MHCQPLATLLNLSPMTLHVARLPAGLLLLVLACVALLPQAARADDLAYTWGDTVLPGKVTSLLAAHLRATQAKPNDYALRNKTAQLAFYAWRLEGKDNKRRLEYARICSKMGLEAVTLKPDLAEGHHWLGAGLGMVGLTRGVLNSLQLVPQIKTAFEKSREIDPDYLDASATLQLGRLLTMLPSFPLSIGDKNKALEYVLDGSKRASNQTLAPLYLADLLWSFGKNGEALAELEKIPNMKPKTEIQFFTYETSKRKAVELGNLIRSGAKRQPFYDVLSDIQPGLVD